MPVPLSLSLKPTSPAPVRRPRRRAWLMALAALTGLGVCLSIPVNFTVVRISEILFSGILWFCIWRLLRTASRPLPKAQALFLILTVLTAGLFCLPGRPPDRSSLEQSYLSRLLAMEGTPYVWGGESLLGTDCSGLPRRAWRGALMEEGLSRLDGHALRAAVEQWWFDTSARALGEGYRGFTVPLGVSGTLDSLDCSALRPGDLAVTHSGTHVLVYAGGENWIQADPAIGHVLTLHARTDQNSWFHVPVSLHRWAELIDPAAPVPVPLRSP